MNSMKSIFIIIITIIAIISFSACNYIVEPQSSIRRNIFPNPLRDYGIISYVVQNESNVSVMVTDNFGREVVKLIDNKRQAPKEYSIEYNFKNVPAGVYNLIIEIDDKVIINEFSIVR